VRLTNAALPLGEHTVFFPERTVPLRAMLGSVGHTHTCDHNYNWHGQKRGRAEFVLIQYTLSGSGRMRINQAEFAVTPGTAMLLHFPDDNQYWLPADSSSWEFIYICLHGREVARLWRSIENRLGVLATLGHDTPAVRCAERIIKQALSGQIRDAFIASALAYELTMSLASEARNPRTGHHSHAALKKAQLYAEKHLADPLTVADLAQQAGMSRFHFSRLFAALTGLPPAAWLVDQRIKEAARLLRGGTLSLKEISTLCGFPNPNYLSRFFRRQTGIPPAS